MTRSEMAKAFTEEGEQMGLKKDTIQKLVAEDIDTSDILRLCSEQDIDEFRFSRGQTLVLKHWVTLLNCEDVASVNPPSETSQTGEVTLHNLLGQMEATVDTGRSSAATPLGKPLLVVDHINCVVGGISDAPEHQVYSQGETQLFFRSARQKPSPDRVTLTQWVGANAQSSAVNLKGEHSVIGGC